MKRAHFNIFFNSNDVKKCLITFSKVLKMYYKELLEHTLYHVNGKELPIYCHNYTCE